MGLRGFLGGMALLILGAATALAQHTVIKKNGVGGRIETDYNAADKAIEMRTIGPDGKLQQKVNYEYLPGYYDPQQTDTTYWPNGQLRKVSRHTYDENSNFIGEFIQTFDETGKQIAGHKLKHDPSRGTYRCEEWDVAKQNYRAVACPSGEEEGGGGGPEEPRKLTYDEVMKYLEAARKNAAVEAAGGGSKGPGASASASKGEVGLILPARVRVGERISGIVVENPARYAEMPEVTVTRIHVPLESEGKGARLAGWLFDAPGEQPRRADGPVTMVVPHGGSLTITLRQADKPAHSVSQTVNFPEHEAATGSSVAHAFEAPALCMKGELCAVRGSFDGDSSKTLAAFEDRPAMIVAETRDVAYISIPELAEPGPRPLLISNESAEGSKVVAFPVVVGRLLIRNNGREVQKDETTITVLTLEGVSGLADAAWQGGNFAAANLERARHLIPGFSLRGEKCEPHGDEAKDASARDEGEVKEERAEADKTMRARGKDEGEDKGEEEKRDEKEEGRILLVLKNLAPNRTALHGSRDEMAAFCLTDEAFQRGDFKYNLRVDARQSGKVEIEGYVIPFLTPVAGQELRAKSAP